MSAACGVRDDGVRTAWFPRSLLSGLRRGVAWGTGAALAAGLLAGVAADDAGRKTAPDLAAVAAVSSPPLRTFSLNVAFPLSKQRAASDMRTAITQLGASVGGFQEISQRADRDSLVSMLRELDWGWYMPRGVAVPVVFDRDRFRLVSGTTIKVHGAEPGVTPSRYINVVRLRELGTDRVFGVINTHTICCASRDAQLSNMHRIPRLRRHFAMLREQLLALREQTDQVVAMGDWNVNYLADRRRRMPGLPTARLGDVVDFDMPLVGSRGKTSLLDYTVSMKNGSLDRTAGRIARGFNSDHQAVVITYDVADATPEDPAPQDPAPEDPAPEDPAPEEPATPRPSFQPGPLTNDPPADGRGDRAVLERTAGVIQAARPGTMLRVATRRLGDPQVTRALLGALARGVLVRVLVHRGARTGQERRLARALAADGSGSTWLQRPRTDSDASFVLVGAAGATRHVTLSISAPLTWRASRTQTTAYLAADGETQHAFQQAFAALRTGRAAQARRAGRATGHGLQVRFGPTAGGADPVVRAIRPVACGSSHSQLRVAVRAWGGRRGVGLARRVASKARHGCRASVLAGAQVGPRVLRVLRGSGVRVRRGPVSQSLLLVDGRYGGRSDQQRTWTGTESYNDPGRRRVAQTLRLTSQATLVTYRQQFRAWWRRAG